MSQNEAADKKLEEMNLDELINAVDGEKPEGGSKENGPRQTSEKLNQVA